MTRLAISFLLAFGLIGCSSVPKSVDVEQTQPLVSYIEAQSLTQPSQGVMARWGGTIAAVRNLAEHTVIEVVHFELDSSAYPNKGSDQSAGRFKAYVNGFLDSEIYKPGRSITILGTVSAPETDKIGEYTYRFPVLKQAKVHLWPEKTPQIEPVYRTPFILHTPIYYRY